MTPIAVVLVVASAFAHAGWNAIAKRGPAGPAYTFVLVAIEAGVLVPVGVVAALAAGVEWSWTWLWVLVVAGALQAVYFRLLRGGYARGDLSVVYPVTRGFGALCAAVLGIAVIGERPGALAVAGAALVIVAVVLLADPRSGSGRAQRGAVVLALCAGVMIGVYSWWDRRAVTDVAMPVLLYTWAAAVLEAAWLAPAGLRDRGALVRALRHWRSAAVAGVLRFGAYALVLLAYAWQSAPLSVVAPLRETGILIGVWIGGTYLGEEDRRRRLIASAVIVAGGVLLVVG